MIKGIVIILLLALLGIALLGLGSFLTLRKAFDNLRFKRSDFIKRDGVLYRKEK